MGLILLQLSATEPLQQITQKTPTQTLKRNHDARVSFNDKLNNSELFDRFPDVCLVCVCV